MAWRAYINWELASTLLDKLAAGSLRLTAGLGISFYPS